LVGGRELRIAFVKEETVVKADCDSSSWGKVRERKEGKLFSDPREGVVVGVIKVEDDCDQLETFESTNGGGRKNPVELDVRPKDQVLRRNSLVSFSFSLSST
jgi:hypothetical protein